MLVDNEIAVQNLTKMAQQKGYQYSAEKAGRAGIPCAVHSGGTLRQHRPRKCLSVHRISAPIQWWLSAQIKWAQARKSWAGALLKAFVFALTQQDKLPKTILFYNGGAALTCEGSPMLEDLKALEAQGVEIMTCGTCLNFYGLTEKLAVGSVTNMYVIVEKLTQAGNVVKP